MEGENYRDADGQVCSLETLCRKEPEWATSIIRSLKNQVAELEWHLGAALKAGTPYAVERDAMNALIARVAELEGVLKILMATPCPELPGPHRAALRCCRVCERIGKEQSCTST